MDKTYRAQVQWQMAYDCMNYHLGAVLKCFSQQYLATIKMAYRWKISVSLQKHFEAWTVSIYLDVLCLLFPVFFFLTLESFLVPFQYVYCGLFTISLTCDIKWNEFWVGKADMFSGLVEDISTSKSSWKISQTSLFFSLGILVPIYLNGFSACAGKH